MTSLTAPRKSAQLCAGFVSVLPVQHAAISTLGDPFEVETVCSTDPLAARLDEVQLDFGEGPCWQASDTRTPVLIPDLRSPAAARWSVLQAAVASRQVQSAYAFPLSVGSLSIGAVDLYASQVHALSEADISTASNMADNVAIHVLNHALARVNEPPETGSSSRRVVHQATGMVIAQLKVSAEDALLIIRAHAFASDRSVRDASADIVARRLDLSP